MCWQNDPDGNGTESYRKPELITAHYRKLPHRGSLTRRKRYYNGARLARTLAPPGLVRSVREQETGRAPELADKLYKLSALRCAFQCG